MPESQLIANYTDPNYNDIKASFDQKSDDYPVVMLPIRLETRFMNETRYITNHIHGQGKVTLAVERIYKIIHDLRVWNSTIKDLTNSEISNSIDEFEDAINLIQSIINEIPELSGDDRRILRNATEDLQTDLYSIKIKKNNSARSKLNNLKSQSDSIKSDVESIPDPSQSIYKKGYAYLDALESIGKSIEKIYVKRSVTANSINQELDLIDTQIAWIYEIIKDSDFRATKNTITKISSKISYIKRTQKNSAIRLRDYRFGYAGPRNLETNEYNLRSDINQLKLKIDNEHVPYMRLLEDLKTYPIRRLTYRINKAYHLLRASNTIGYSKYNGLMEVKEWLYDQLHSIRERAHRPLDGDLEDIGILKTQYAKLETEVVEFINQSKSFQPNDRYKKAALTRLRTHLTDEYLDDLEDLLPGKKSTDEQSFVDSKVRNTSTASIATKTKLTEIRDWVKNNSDSTEKAIYDLRDQLQQYKGQIAISSTNTVLIPKSQFLELQSIINSIKSHITNLVNRNKIATNHPVLNQSQGLISDIENYVLDQQTDVFDQRDRFYDDYKKRITFTLKTETIKELWVRIFPDDISVDNHDERISPEEEKIGHDYYYEVYSKPANDREAFKLPAWRALAASLGVRRGAYIIKALEPVEVKNNTVEELKNDLNELLIEAKKFIPRKRFLRFEENLNEKESFISFVNSLAGNLQNLLLPSAFSICLENKQVLDDFLSTIKSIIRRLYKELDSSKVEVVLTRIKSQIEKLTIGGNIIADYYKTNLEALNRAFKPTLNFTDLDDDNLAKEKPWDRAGFTEVLPDKFVVVTKRGDTYQHIVTGRSVTKPLQLSIDPSGDQADRFKRLENGELEVPEELRWMFDFDAAIEAGMAVRIPLQEDDFNLGFDLVMAFGIQDTGAEEGQMILNKLFTNHLYSDGGLEYLPVGTATNNTDEVKSPYTALDNDFDGAFELFFGDNEPNYLTQNDNNELDISDGQFFRDALGISDDIANYIRNHDKMDIANGRAMNRALYNSTLKYYMSIMVKNLINDNDKGRTLPFLMRHVSAIGNVPSFRIDQQPYGVLPITNYKAFKVSGNTAKGSENSYMKNLTIFLNATRKAFDSFSKKPQTVNGEKYKNDPQQEFLKILGLEPYSKEFYYRFGTNLASRWNEPDTLQFSVNWDNSNDEFAPGAIANYYNTLLKGLGHTTQNTRTNAISKTKAYINRFMDGNYIIGDIVQDHELGIDKLGEVEGYDNYIDWFLDKTRTDINPFSVGSIPKVDGKTQNTLLFMMLRGALLYDSSSFAKRAIEKIKELDVLTLERLLANHIDLCSYRLDAWLGGLSNYRLRELRSSKPNGTYIGAYGFVQGLKLSPPLEKVTILPDGLTPTNGSDVFKMPENQGFIHGPSMNHAIAAAVLRSGYNSLKKRGNNNNALAINLSSSRVRQALQLLQGVSNGQEAGALLGYMMERALHDKYKDGQGKFLEMDVYIYRLRRKFPTFGDMPKDSDIDLTQYEKIKAANVLDGLAMIDHFEDFIKNKPYYDENATFVEMLIDDSGLTPVFNGHPWGFTNREVPDPAQPSTNSTAELERLKLRAIIHEMDNMADAFDALGDLMTSEGVYQLVRGNHVKASAVLNSLAEGKVPMDPDIIKSLRTGSMVTHRAVVNLPVINNSTSPWNGVDMSPRAKAEPSLNNWLAAQIGSPDEIDWFTKYANIETHLSLKDLNLQPIDLVWLIATGGEESMSEFEMRSVDYLIANGASEEDEFEFNFNDHSPSATFSFGEVISLFQHLGKTITTSRICDARDFRIPEDELNFELTAGGIQTDEIKSRIESALSDYQILLDNLSAFEASKEAYSESEMNLAIQKLMELSNWGFPGFYPLSDSRKDVLSMASRIITAKNKITSNIDTIQGLLSELELELDQTKWISSISEIGTKLFGNGFKFLPQYENTQSADAQLQLNMSHEQGIIRHHSNDFMEDWLSSAALVRSRLSSIETTRILTDVLHDQKESLAPIQFPFNEPADIADRDYWMGAEYPDSFKPEGDRISILCVGHENIANISCGLVLDEWMEIIPDEKETTGIALHYNQPDARAPQSLLLAVTPEKTGNWKLEDLALTVEEALNMAKLRSVEPEHVDFSMFSQLLPATSTLAFGFDEMARRLFPDEDFDVNEQELGLYIDYTAVNSITEEE